MGQPRLLTVAVSPLSSELNSFVDRFSECLARMGFDVTEFSWRRLLTDRPRIVIWHWPDNAFFESISVKPMVRWGVAQIVRWVYGTKFVWVVHNIRPHDLPGVGRGMPQLFIRLFSGVIYLSQYSRQEVRHVYHPPAATRELVTVHGHYRDKCTSPPKPSCRVEGHVRLAFAGQVRPYKNIETLVRVVGGMRHENVTLTVTGRYGDQDLADRIKAVASSYSNVYLDLRPTAIPNQEMESVIDRSDLVVLPYHDIAHSGMALFALSRNRPILAPRIGSLPELQEKVGSEWIHLYSGEFSEAVLEEGLAWLRHRGGSGWCDLSAFDWEPIAEDIGRFLTQLVG